MVYDSYIFVSDIVCRFCLFESQRCVASPWIHLAALLNHILLIWMSFTATERWGKASQPANNNHNNNKNNRRSGKIKRRTITVTIQFYFHLCPIFVLNKHNAIAGWSHSIQFQQRLSSCCRCCCWRCFYVHSAHVAVSVRCCCCRFVLPLPLPLPLPRSVVSFSFSYVEFGLNIAIYGHEMFDRSLRTLSQSRADGFEPKVVGRHYVHIW